VAASQFRRVMSLTCFLPSYKRLYFEVIGKTKVPANLPKGGHGGFLIKRAIDSGRNWKKRYFELDAIGCRLKYFKIAKAEKAKSRKPQGVFDLTRTVVVKCYFDENEDNPEDRPNCFELRSTETGRVLIMSAEQSTDMRVWLEKLAAVITYGDSLRKKHANLKRKQGKNG
jgi:hypothetical protein